MEDYIIVNGVNCELLLEKIKLFSDSGYVASGGPFHDLSSKSYNQLMVKSKKKEYGIIPQHISVTDYQTSVKDWKTKFNKFSEFGKAFPIVDIKGELEKAALWLYTNTSKRKKAFDRFFNNWCARIQEKGVTTNTPLNNPPPMEDL